MRRSTFPLLVLALSLMSSAVSATVTEPNGLVVPRDSMNGEEQLYTLFTSRGETFDWQADAAATPATFSPLCNFQATFVLHQSASSLGIGWYNADATTPPDTTEIYQVLPAGSSVGAMVTASDIRGDPNWHGGAVGFAIVGDQTHYSEYQWNPACTGCTPPGPWYLAVIYRSTTTPNAYYVAWEDGPVGPDPGDYSNDGDYNDYVMFFEGLVCMGGGMPCDTGMLGICSAGITDCNTTGIVCTPTVTPRTESCNGLDDDCNGTVDDGSGLCPASEVCAQGTCVPMCLEGSCFAGQVCTSAGLCVDAACASVTCPGGQVCTAGTCHGPCDGVVCPGMQACRAGRCVDPCAGVTCATGDVCSAGACIPDCNCLPCPTSTSCDATSGTCGETACVGVTCTGDDICRAGTCVDPCTGAVCPAGQSCSMGSCVDLSPDAGVVDAGSGDAGHRDASASDAASGDASHADGSAHLDGRTDDGGSTTGAHGSCGCRAVGTGAASWAWLTGLAFAMGLIRRRRRAS